MLITAMPGRFMLNKDRYLCVFSPRESIAAGTSVDDTIHSGNKNRKHANATPGELRRLIRVSRTASVEKISWMRQPADEKHLDVWMNPNASDFEHTIQNRSGWTSVARPHLGPENERYGGKGRATREV